MVTWICQNWYMDFSQLLLGFVKFDAGICQNWYSYFSKLLFWICQSCYMDLLKLLHGFVKVVLYISSPLPSKSKLKFNQDLKACWSFCVELKVLNEWKYSMPWACCAFCNVFIMWVQRLWLPRRVHDISINMLRGYLEVHSLQPDWDLKKVTLTNFSHLQFDLFLFRCLCVWRTCQTYL